MECFEIKNVSFCYAGSSKKSLDGVNLTVKKGDFVTICGKSGSGKTTLLRLLKPIMAPNGNMDGKILFFEKDVDGLNTSEQASKIGFVMQNPDNQIVTDKVWHELAFGLEGLGYSTEEIRTRVSEMASFFGIQEWFHKKVTDLSGGQKQLLNLAGVMVMQPEVLLLDEPTSRLDPIAAGEFLRTVKRINREFGTTVILSEHRLEEAFSLSDRIVIMDGGRIKANDLPCNIGKILKASDNEMYAAMPAPIKIYEAVENEGDCPITVRDGRLWLEDFAKGHTLKKMPSCESSSFEDNVVEIRDVWFRYDKNLPDVIKGLKLSVRRGELLAIVGGNGVGKTTLLSVISGLDLPYRGEVLINGTKISKLHNLYTEILGVLPQEPTSLFVKKTVKLDLLEMLSESGLKQEEKENRIAKICSLCQIEALLNRHPYDLSGGEQQRTALAKLLLKSPKILLLDEPTKGLDAAFKTVFADILKKLTGDGVTVIMVSHDIEFCAEYADRCALMFDGIITSEGRPREFFKGKSFYTTAANRMARTVIPDAVLAEDVIYACGGKFPKKEGVKAEQSPKKISVEKIKDKKKVTPTGLVFGIIFAIAFVLTAVSYMSAADFLHLKKISWLNDNIFSLSSIGMAFVSLLFLLPKKEFELIKVPEKQHKIHKRTIISAFLILLAIPFTIFAGVYYFGDRKYYFISLLIILETLLPFVTVFESRKPNAREIVVISVLCAIAVAGRAAFAMLYQFKPVTALIIISGVCLGGEAGFLVGSITGFVSNFIFGQGPWTPWQMFAFGMIGFAAGILTKMGILRKSKLPLCIFGILSVILIYGGIMNPASVIMSQTKPTAAMIIASYALGIPFDIIHAVSTAFFMWFLAEPMIEKLERIKIKYGFTE